MEELSDLTEVFQPLPDPRMGCLIPPLASAFNGSHTLAVKRRKDSLLNCPSSGAPALGVLCSIWLEFGSRWLFC